MRLAGLRPGTKVAIEGPYGKLTGERRVTGKLAMFACGIGITPLRALLEELAYRPGDAVLVYRAHDLDDLVFRNELDQLARRRGITVHYVLGRMDPEPAVVASRERRGLDRRGRDAEARPWHQPVRRLCVRTRSVDGCSVRGGRRTRSSAEPASSGAVLVVRGVRA